jgi:hypothetical protein
MPDAHGNIWPSLSKGHWQIKEPNRSEAGQQEQHHEDNAFAEFR